MSVCDDVLETFSMHVARAIWDDRHNETAWILRNYQEVAIGGARIYAGALSGNPEYYLSMNETIHGCRQIIEEVNLVAILGDWVPMISRYVTSTYSFIVVIIGDFGSLVVHLVASAYTVGKSRGKVVFEFATPTVELDDIVDHEALRLWMDFALIKLTEPRPQKLDPSTVQYFMQTQGVLLSDN